MISKNGQYEAIRISKNDVQVSCIKGRNIYTSYVIMATAAGTVGQCTCSYGKRAGTTCPHMDLVKALVAAEQAPVVEVKPVDTFKTWLQEVQDAGDLLFA